MPRYMNNLLHYSLSWLIISRIVFILGSLVAVFIIPIREGYLGKDFGENMSPFIAVWSNFDGRHFLSIATQGYHNTNFAYFPLYPLVINILSFISSLNPMIVGIFISLISLYISCIYLHKIVLVDFDKKVADLAVKISLFYPLSFYYNSVYADSLFFLFSILSFYYARKEKWLLSGLFGAMAILTRLSGVALLPALVFEWYSQSGKSVKNYKDMITNFIKSQALRGIFVASTGLIVYMVYLQVNYGDFLLFQKSMSAWGQSNVTFPLQVVYRYFKIFVTVSPLIFEYWVSVFEFLTILIYGLLSIYVATKVRLSYGIFMIVLLLLVPLTGTFAGTPRYILHLFPGFLSISLLINDRTFLKRLIFTCFVILSIILSGLFTRGYFIA